jgi:hypothetical protein
MSRIAHSLAFALLPLLAACNQPMSVVPPLTASVGLYELQMRGSASPGVTSLALQESEPGLTFERLYVNTLAPGNAGGEQFVNATFRVTNTSGRALQNLTLIPVDTAEDDDAATPTLGLPTLGNTPFSKMLYFDGTDAREKASSLTLAPAATNFPYGAGVHPDPEGTPYLRGLDTASLSVPIGGGLKVVRVWDEGWRLPTTLEAGASTTVTFSTYFNVALDGRDPYSYSLVFTAATEAVPPVIDFKATVPEGSVQDGRTVYFSATQDLPDNSRIRKSLIFSTLDQQKNLDLTLPTPQVLSKYLRNFGAFFPEQYCDVVSYSLSSLEVDAVEPEFTLRTRLNIFGGRALPLMTDPNGKKVRLLYFQQPLQGNIVERCGTAEKTYQFNVLPGWNLIETNGAVATVSPYIPGTRYTLTSFMGGGVGLPHP